MIAVVPRSFSTCSDTTGSSASPARPASTRGVPGHLLGRVAQEIGVRQLRPDAVDGAGGHALAGEQAARRLLRLALELVLVDRALEAAPQRALDPLVELVEQRRLPGVPQLRVGAAHVGDRQHVEVVEVGLVADALREAVDHLRVGDVLLLRRDRQLQVVLDQPGDQARIVARQALLEAEGLGIDRAELRMVAAAALGDVVEQRREVGHFLARQRLHDPRQVRQLVVEARDREPAQVADDEQRVRVDRVGVEQVVLHAADDAAERRDVAAEHAVGVHAPQLVRDAGRARAGSRGTGGGCAGSGGTPRRSATGGGRSRGSSRRARRGSRGSAAAARTLRAARAARARTPRR